MEQLFAHLQEYSAQAQGELQEYHRAQGVYTKEWEKECEARRRVYEPRMSTY
jgi:hypothetical protein